MTDPTLTLKCSFIRAAASGPKTASLIGEQKLHFCNKRCSFIRAWRLAASVQSDQGKETTLMLRVNIEPAHKLKIDQNKLQNCRSNILNLVNVL
ncbi:hypothetical protein D1AOALGA4SA_7945 [Olavius algarvensis Delta 1 endosymbiont]|nr:hypothetical protein D1AOALGA4SA_7945 [Olavius algarvensis Delta 1 endosymbiont]